MRGLASSRLVVLTNRSRPASAGSVRRAIISRLHVSRIWRSSPGTSAKERWYGRKVERPALLHPVCLRVAVEVDNSLVGLRVAEPCEGGDERAGADTGNHVEARGTCKRMGFGNGAPAFEEACAKRTDIAAAGDDQVIDHRRCRSVAGLVLIELRLGPLELRCVALTGFVKVISQVFVTALEERVSGVRRACYAAATGQQRGESRDKQERDKKA